jgi:hypothetical protein
MQFLVTMRDGSSYEIEANYLEVHDGPSSSSYALLGIVPGYPVAILAAFPIDMVSAIVPRSQLSYRT